jgi:hypothetical protein
MQARRTSVTFTEDQLALILVEEQAAGIDRSAVVRRCVSTGLAHHRGSAEYKAMLPVAHKLRERGA